MIGNAALEVTTPQKDYDPRRAADNRRIRGKKPRWWNIPASGPSTRPSRTFKPRDKTGPARHACNMEAPGEERRMGARIRAGAKEKRRVVGGPRWRVNREHTDSMRYAAGDVQVPKNGRRVGRIEACETATKTGR
ncbi:hypothetical protein B0H13DRAFT_1905972 [Mycena leptocephala]|nr:hypothetical protein B0H13DRAFT_1905972 [Mycena leptocephala]